MKKPVPRAVRAWAIAREGRIILALVNTDRWKRNDLVDNEEAIRVLVTPVLPRRAPTPEEIEREARRLLGIGYRSIGSTRGWVDMTDIERRFLRALAKDSLRRRGR